VEAPTYDRALAIGRRHGAAMHAVEHDAEGLDPDALARELERDRSPAFLYLLPTFQNPTGRTLSLDRRRRVVELAAVHDLVVLEDDPYRHVRFGGNDLASLRELAGGERVLYSSSFSKIVAPGLRVGYLVVPEALGAELERAAVGTYLAPTFPTQAIVYEFLSRGLLDANVARVSRLLGARRDALVGALEQHLPGATWTTPEGGYFLWLRLPEGAEAHRLLDAAEEHGVTFVLGDDFYLDGGGADAARLAFSYPSPVELVEAAERLAAALASIS
jgi:DNA-binding transcriptional MocR family regulator